MPNTILITPNMIWERIPARNPESHKGIYGSVLALCGCEKYRGAATLCVMGALRSGAGLVTLAATEAVISSVAGRILEATFFPLPPVTTPIHCDTAVSEPLPEPGELIYKIRRAKVCAAGCGKPESPATVREMEMVLRHATGTVVLDAGGLCSMVTQQTHTEGAPQSSCGSLFTPATRSLVDTRAADSCETAAKILATCADRLIITPHPGEMAKLTGLSVAQIKETPASAALDYAAKTGAIVVLKGHRTLIASPDGRLYENRTGNAGLARGGSGDVLTGIIAGLAAQGLSPLDAAVCGVWLHGSAAERCALRKSMMGMLPSDILEDLGQIFLEHGR